MTLRDLMNRHARTVLTRADHFGELVTYQFKSGAPDRVVRAVVDRQLRRPEGEGGARFVRNRATVFIPRHATDGVTSIERGGDKLLFAMELGGDEVVCRIDEIVDQDEAGFTVEVIG